MTCMTCPIPVPPKIITAADITKPCGRPADVLTAVPGTDRRTGRQIVMLQFVCLHHSITIACYKAIENLQLMNTGDL